MVCKSPNMLESNAFDELIRRVRSGDEEAATELVRLYEPAIRRAARVRLVDSRLRRIFDSMDISQSVFASFFLRAALGQYELDKPERLLRLLVDMSRKKLADHVREEQAARRDYRRLRVGSKQTAVLTADDPGPAQQVAAKELLREFRKRLSPDERQLAELRASGKNWAQIALQCRGTSEALRKRLTRAVDRVARELGLESSPDE
jgi:RNA polymerase sigma factor (sigma-70 family)